MINDDRVLILEEELLIVRHSGEIPEVVLHSTLDYLCNDPEGPGMLLCHEELALLHDAVKERYLEIIFRDLTPTNRELSMYRGVKRAMINWQRLRNFCDRSDIESVTMVEPVAGALLGLLRQELKEQHEGQAISAFNCSKGELAAFFDALRIPQSRLPEEWAEVCVAG